MRCCSIIYNKKIFAAYTGLIASGYNLADERWIQKIHDIVNDVPIGDEILAYFKKARTTSCEVNPYWPKAFLLTLACMYISDDRPYRYNNFENLTNHINIMKQINPDEINEDAFMWLKELPYKLELLCALKGFDKLWNDYLYEINQLSEYYNVITSQAVSTILNIFNINEENLPEVTVIPNPLQAPQATDIIEKDDKVYIIKSKPDKESVIHEILHHIFGEKLEECRETINNYLFLLKPVLGQMIRFQYAWNYDENSWNRVFEENFMRAASIWVNYCKDMGKALEKTNLFKSYGFIYVPVILKCFSIQWKGMDKFNNFIEECLKSCNMIN